MSTSIVSDYQGASNPGIIPVLAIAISVAVHAALLMGFTQPHMRTIGVRPDPDPPPTWTPVEFKPETSEIDKPRELIETPAPPTIAVPKLADIPVVRPLHTDFTEDLDPIHLKTDGPTNLVTIPTNIRPTPEAARNGKIFDPNELDKKPEPVSRPFPTFPYELQRTLSGGSVQVGFIVDSHGNVVQPRIVSSSHHGFEQAALSAIARWKFRPGIKNGRKVNTRVEQPIMFVLKEDR